jgi:hypothetical protein
MFFKTALRVHHDVINISAGTSAYRFKGRATLFLELEAYTSDPYPSTYTDRAGPIVISRQYVYIGYPTLDPRVVLSLYRDPLFYPQDPRWLSKGHQIARNTYKEPSLEFPDQYLTTRVHRRSGPACRWLPP